MAERTHMQIRRTLTGDLMCRAKFEVEIETAFAARIITHSQYLRRAEELRADRDDIIVSLSRHIIASQVDQHMVPAAKALLMYYEEGHISDRMALEFFNATELFTPVVIFN